MKSHTKSDEPEMLLDMHVLPTVKDLNAYSSKEKTILEKLMDVLAEKISFEPINLNDYLSTMTKHTCYILMKKLKTHGLTMCDIALFSSNYSVALGNIFFVWKEEILLNLSSQTRLINDIQGSLPKYFSRAHNAQACLLTEQVLFNKITAEFCAIYAELTGDQSVFPCAQSKDVDACHKAVMNNLTPSIAKNSRMNNTRKEKFDKFWNIASEVIEEITAVDDCRHGEAYESGKK